MRNLLRIIAARRLSAPNFLDKENRLTSPSVKNLALLAAFHGVGVPIGVDWYVQEFAVIITLTREGSRLAVSILDNLSGVKWRPRLHHFDLSASQSELQRA